MMACLSSSTFLKTPRRMRFRVISAKKRSTMLSHEPDVGVDTLPSIHEPLWIAVSGATPFQQAVDRAGGYAD